MNYNPPTPPLGITWEDAPAYTAPPLPVAVTWEPDPAGVAGSLRAASHRPTAGATATAGLAPAIIGAIRATAYRAVITAAGTVPAVAAVRGVGHRPVVTAAGAPPIAATVRAAGHRSTASAVGIVPVVATVRGLGHHPEGTLSGTVVRYELRGSVRNQGMLVERRVRAYRRDTGALVGEADTVGGYFQLHVGFEGREHYIVPVHLDETATDYSPPCVNRVVSVLAQDAS